MDLLKALEGIKPAQLNTSSYLECFQQLLNTTSTSIISDSTNLLLLVQAIKSCKVACYKRDILLDVLDRVIFSPSIDMLKIILCDNIQSDSDRDGIWKDMSNVLVNLPDLVANCNSLKKYPRFKNDTFYSYLLGILYGIIDSRDYKTAQVCFIIQLIGRIAISGFGNLVWKEFTFKVLLAENEELLSSVSSAITFPLHHENQISSQFEMYIEPLYFPIFSNLKPTRRSGKLINSLLGDKIRNHHFFEYILCNKFTLQTNYFLKRHQQQKILFNIFSYLADLSDTVSGERKEEEEEEEKKEQEDTSSLVINDFPKNNKLQRSNNLLIKTLLEVAQSWSNETKILFRPYEQNRYITSALIIGFRYAFEKDKQLLAEFADEIQSKIVQGFPIYLNRASFEHRNLSMCLGEILLPKLCELIGSRLKIKKEKETLDFNVEWNDDCKALRMLMFDEIEEIFKENVVHENDQQHLECDKDRMLKDEKRELDSAECNISNKQEDEACIVDEDDACIIDEDKQVPMYLSDCIAGLVQNDNPNYVRLCLVKAIDQLNVLKKETEIGSCNDAIKDIAIELAQALLYLDDQFNIENFDSYRMKALCSISVANPELVVKYLLDEFNGSNRNTRQQLEILQVLVKTAQSLPSAKFVKYVSLFFYGIIYQLKADILPLAIVSAATKAASVLHKDKLDDSYLLSRIFFSISEVIKCVYQQPITCKLSNDLLDVLAAYRNHPDSGVRKSIVSCLTVIKECTASVYFKEFLHDKTVNLFEDWLANEADLLELSRFIAKNKA